MPVFEDVLTGIEIYGNSGMAINAIRVTEQGIGSNSSQVSDILNTYKSFLFLGITLSKIIIGILVYIFLVICLRKIFKKAGRKGWESLIPIRNIFILFEIVGKTIRFWLIILPFILILFMVIFRILMFLDTSNGFYNLAYLILTIANTISLVLALILIILSCFRLAKKFGKSGWFGLGLLFLTPIFLGILAFGKSEYIGENN